MESDDCSQENVECDGDNQPPLSNCEDLLKRVPEK